MDESVYRLRRVGSPATLSEVANIFELTKDVTLIGRAKGKVDFYLDSSKNQGLISRIHARIFKTKSQTGEDNFKICDTSLNGTFVNNIKILNEAPLGLGDSVAFGHLKGAALHAGNPYPQPHSEFHFQFEKSSEHYSSNTNTVNNNKTIKTNPETINCSTNHIKTSPNASEHSVFFETPTSVALMTNNDLKACTTKRELVKNFIDSDNESDFDILQEYATAARLAAEIENDSDEELFSVKYTDILPGGARINNSDDGNKEPDTRRRKRKSKSPQTKSRQGPQKATKQENSNTEDCSAMKCLKPKGKIIPWVQCDDCDLWYHVKCAGLTMQIVKPKNAKFHCGCR